MRGCDLLGIGLSPISHPIYFTRVGKNPINITMQTFLPYFDFEKTFKCLDFRRLNKQRIEARQIYNIITNQTTSSAWRHHPAVLEWQSYENSLALYHNLCIEEWIKRGYNNNMKLIEMDEKNIIHPWWLGNEEFHKSHRQTLLFKNYEYYSQFGWKESPKYEYWWPTKHLLDDILPELKKI